jgi:Tfp pilus assembly protein PilF
VAAFAHAIRRASTDAGLPDCLHGENEPELRLRGVDFEQNRGQDAAAAEQALKAFAEQHAGRAFALSALPFTTERKTLFDDMRKASVALMPSWHEGFGLVAWEAIAAGVPLIVSAKSGVHKLLKDNFAGDYTAIDVAGQSVEPFYREDDCTRLAGAIIQAAKNRGLYKEKASRLRSRLLDLYSWRKCAGELALALGWQASLVAEGGAGLMSLAGQVGQGAPFVPGGLAGGLPSPQSSQSSQSPQSPQSPHAPPSPPSPKSAQPLAASPADRPDLLPLPRGKWHKGCGLSDSQILRAEEAIVPFEQDRVPFLAEQLAWAQAPTYPLAVRLLTGAGGVGKTRLALECCQRLRAAGWQAGFLPGEFQPAQAAALAREMVARGQSACVVLDYAETRQEVLLALLKVLLQSGKAVSVRVLLLARDGGEWWQNLPGKDAECDALLSGYACTGPFALPMLHDGIEERQAAYQRALHTFAAELDLVAPQHMPDLTQVHFSQPLYLQMGALLALRGERPETAQSLARALVNHERRYWRVSQEVPAAGIEAWQRQAALLMTIATLAGGFATVREVEQIWPQAGGEKAWLKPLFRQLAGLYPGGPGLQGLRPDLLGETLVAQVLLDLAGQDVLQAILKHGSSQGRHSALTVVARMLRHSAMLAPVIENALQTCFMACVREIMTVCVQTASILPQIVEQAYARLLGAVQAQVAGLLSPQFQFEIVPLAGLEVLVRQTLVDNAAKHRQKKPGQEADAPFAGEVSNLAVACFQVGQHDQALQFAKQALAIREKLAQARPERFEPDFAQSLANYAEFLAAQGQLDQALQFAKQALVIREKLAQAKPERFEPDLATSLSNYANYLANQGQQDQALQFAKQALDIFEKLAQAKPERFEPDFAHSLANYAGFLSEQGQHDLALQFSKQALDIRKKLAQTKPERFDPDFAHSLSNYAALLSDQGQHDQALQFDKQALDIREKLAQAKPERFEPDFATSLSGYANSLSNQGQHDQALQFAKQALAIREKLAQAKPERFAPDFATSLSGYAVFLSNQGQHDQASQFAKQARDILEKLAQTKPERFEPNFAHSLSNYSTFLSKQGQHDQALQFAKQALAIREKLAQAKPERFEPDFATSLSNCANLLSDQGQFDQALQFAKQALDIRERLAQTKPERFEPDFATSLSNYAGLLSDQGQHDQALQIAKQALAIRERLAQAKPERFEPDFAASLNNYSGRLAEVGQLATASSHAEQANQIYQRCAARVPTRYTGYYEDSRLKVGWWQWLATGRNMAPRLAQALPTLPNSREQAELSYWHRYLQACNAPDASTIPSALASWDALDKAQQLGWLDTFIILAALTETVLGPAAAPQGWRQTLADLRQRYRGQLPQWMLEAARRLGCTLE